MSRIDPLRGRLGRRDLLKVTGAAAGVAALGDLTGRSVLPVRSALARQDAATRSSSAVAPTSTSSTRARSTPKRPTSSARTSTTAWSSTTRRDDDPAGPRRIVGDLRRRPGLHVPPAPGREIPRRRGVQRRRGGHLVQLDRPGGAPGSQYDATTMPYIKDFITDWVDTVEAVDEYTVKMTLPKPYAPLLANLAIPIAGIISPKALSLGLDELAVNPSGTGAFKLAKPEDWVRDSQMVLEANPDYWGGAPKVAQLIFKVIPEELDPPAGASKPARSTSPVAVVLRGRGTGARQPGSRHRRRCRAERQLHRTSTSPRTPSPAKKSARPSTTR